MNYFEHHQRRDELHYWILLGIGDDLVVPLNEPKSKIQGHVLKSFLGQDYYGFQEIPYAVPPVGEFRFTEPKPHPGWEGILNTTSNTKICMETNSEGITGIEDCLVLNVYTPVRNSSAKLPVLFWILGGAFQRGSAPYQRYNPHYFADYGLVIVTFNYRVGPLGFLTTEDGVVPGNLGLKDQALALRWVNKNIEIFGGDPQKVTIAGESAGSMSVSHHFISQKSTGLYRAAIMASGSALTHGAYVEHARNYSFQLGRNLDNKFMSDDSKELLKLLKSVSAEDILIASAKVQKIEKDIGIEKDLAWAPVIESDKYKNAFITKPMRECLENGHFDKVPIFIGFTSEEIVTRIESRESVEQLAALADESPANLIHAKWHIPIKDQVAAGTAIKKLYTNRSFFEDLPAFITYSSDMFLVEGAIHQANLSSASVPVYMYQFSYEGSQHTNVNISGVIGAGHAEDLFYTWFDLDLDANDILTSKRMVTLWSNFIKYLNPTPTVDTALKLPIWPRVAPNKLVYLDIDRKITIKANPKKYLEVSAIFKQYMKPPFVVY